MSAELLKTIYDYLIGIRKPFDQRDRIEEIRYLLNQVEDGCLSWEEIKENLRG